jgi:hypothetical protein
MAALDLDDLSRGQFYLGLGLDPSLHPKTSPKWLSFHRLKRAIARGSASRAVLYSRIF